ncbi:hypothetical protein EPN96_12040 [bacterium]|nr:MAG: hypothetical protein EPN96_12040 [bacterium]
MKSKLGILALGIFMAIQAGTASANTQDDIVALQAAVAALTARVVQLEAYAPVELEGRLSAVEANTALQLDGYVGVDTNSINGLAGPHVIFTGANFHVRDGSGATWGYPSPVGLGNLIVGYNENNAANSRLRTGSHNFVVGLSHEFTGYAGFLAGDNNAVVANFASISGGSGNRAEAEYSSISGGAGNITSGGNSSVSGGAFNVASGSNSSVSGGNENVAGGYAASVSGGRGNTTANDWASVSGGQNNIVSGMSSSISGGAGLTVSDHFFWAASGTLF